MIQDIMSTSFAVFTSEDAVEAMARAIGKRTGLKYVIVQFPSPACGVWEAQAARDILVQIGEKLGPDLLSMPLKSIPPFQRTCDGVQIRDSEAKAVSLALRCPEKQVAVLDQGKPVGVVKAEVRGALFGVPSTLYGERFDIFEKGTVKPRYQLQCSHCHARFDFYIPRFEQGKIVYCCPKCDHVLEE